MSEKTGAERSAFGLTTSETVAEEASAPNAIRLAVSVALVNATGSATSESVGAGSLSSTTFTRRISAPSPPRPPVELDGRLL